MFCFSVRYRFVLCCCRVLRFVVFCSSIDELWTVQGSLSARCPLALLAASCLARTTKMMAPRSCVLALLVHFYTDAAAFEYTGYLVDNYCWERTGHTGLDQTPLGTNPGGHILHCLFLDACIPKGWALLELLSTPASDGSTYGIKYQLDDAGDLLVKELVMAEHDRAGDRAFGDKVTVKGTVAGTTINVEKICFTPSVDNSASSTHCYTAPTTAFAYTGYLVDNYCWNMPNHIGLDATPLGTNPGGHILHCLFLPQCLPTGWALLEKFAQADSDGYMYGIKYQLDDAGDMLAKALVMAEHARGGDRSFNDQVTVSGREGGATIHVTSICFTPSHDNAAGAEICQTGAAAVSGSSERHAWIGAAAALMYTISFAC